MTATPTFVIAGAMRSGTTALAAWLRDHPDVYMAPVKEIHYFDRHYDEGPDWYAAHFEGRRDETAVGEATPNYLYQSVALERLRADVPDVRLVILLRDPIGRAHSHYLQRVARGGEDLSFEAAIAAEPERLATGDELDRAHFSYVDRGHYLGQVRRVYELFPVDAVSIHLFEDLRDRPREVFGDVARFLGVDPDLVPDSVGEQANAYQQFRSLKVRDAARRLPKPLRDAVGRLNRLPVDRYPDLAPTTVERLARTYAAERDELAGLLGRDLHEWQL
jgi:hypothetical protein